MAQQKTFRTALNGFNREDVVSYIEYLNSVHAAEINQLNTELNFFQNKQPEAACVPESAEVCDDQHNDVLKQQAARIRELFDRCRELEEKLAAAEEAKARAEEEKAHAEEKLQAALSQQTTFQSLANEELEAYRRAERMERLAKERAEQMYQKTNGVLAEASIRVDEAAGQIGQLSDRVMEQLTLLQNAVSGSKVAMKEASQIMYAIRPEEK